MATNQTSQGTFRFRNDDGSESAASWKGAENANGTITQGSIFRLRFRIYQTAGTVTRSYKLQYNLNGAGWLDVNATSAIVQSHASAFVSDNTATSRQLSTTGNFTNGVVDTSDGATNSVTLTTPSLNSDTEDEFCLQLLSSGTVDGDVVQFRIVGAGATLLTAYDTSPQLTVQAMSGRTAILNAVLDQITFSGQAKVKVQGVFAVTLADIVFAGTTSSGIHGMLNAVLDSITFSGHVGVTPPGTHRVDLGLTLSTGAQLSLSATHLTTLTIDSLHRVMLRLDPISPNMDPQRPYVGQQVRLGMLFYNNDVLTDPSTITLVRKDQLGVHTTSIAGLTHLGTGSYCLDTTVQSGAGLTHWYCAATGINAVETSRDDDTNYTVLELPF